MKNYIFSLWILGFLVLWSSCRNDFETVPSTGKLEFSKDTVYLDTVFSNIGSSTYTLKVYNRSKEDIHIPVVKLGEGENSHYRLNVDGIPGKVFHDVEILAKDSIFIFIETTLDINNFPGNLNFLYTDVIEFDSGTNLQTVDLVTLVQDAVFLYPDKYEDGTYETLVIGEGEDAYEIYGFFLNSDELHFTNEKPYVIYGYAAIPPNETLLIDPGARIHFHEASGIIAAQGSSIKSLGALSNDPELLENEIIFQGDRLEPFYENRAGQWGMIWLTAGSTGHEFNYTTIKNNVVGLLMDSNDGTNTPNLQLKNTQIYNTALNGILSRTGFIDAENLVVANSGSELLSLTLGGRYHFRHSTFANYSNFGGFRSEPSVYVSNFLQISDTEILTSDLIEATFSNCIIYGNNQREFIVGKHETTACNFQLSHSLIRFEDPQGIFEDDPLYDFTNPDYYQQIVVNQAPLFMSFENNQYFISHQSAANGIGDPAVTSQVPYDILGTLRTIPSDAGAYESIEFP
jgi:hypothetical protein